MAESIVQLPIEQLVANPQVRQHFDAQAEQGLAQSIREVGILQPIRVRTHDGKSVIVDGERRYRAAKLAGLTTVPVIQENQELDCAAIIQRQLIANCQRTDLRPLELARSIAQLIKFGCSQSEVAKKLGMPDAAITRSLAILALPAPIRDQVDAGQIPASAAYELARVKDPQRQAHFAALLASGQLTRDGLAGAVRAERTARPVAPNMLPRATASLGDKTSLTVAAPELDMERFIALLGEVLKKARKARTRGIDLSAFCRALKAQGAQ